MRSLIAFLAYERLGIRVFALVYVSTLASCGLISLRQRGRWIICSFDSKRLQAIILHQQGLVPTWQR